MKLVIECASNNGWQEVKVKSSSDKKKTYTVTLPPWERTMDEIVCECPSYEYRGYCRHQAQALASLCGWNDMDGKEQSLEQKKDSVCPECGGATVSVWYPGKDE